MAEARVRGVLSARDETAAAVKSARKRIRGLETDFKRVGQTATKVGRGLTLGVTAPIAGFGALSIRTAASFEASMKRVEAKSKVAGKSIADLRAQAAELGRTTQFSAREAADAQEILATSGFNTAQNFAALPGVLDLAAAGSLELAEAASFTSATMKNFNLDASRAGDIADLLAKGQLLANQSVADLGAAMSKSGAIADGFGISLEDTAASLSVLAEKNVKAEEGGIAFRNFLLEIKDPASKARKFLDNLGLSVEGADGKLKSISEIMATFRKAGINASNVTDVFNKRVAATFVQLASGETKLSEFNKELQDRTGTAAKIAEKNLEGFSGEMKKLQSALEGLQIAIADSGLLDFATKLVERIGELVSTISSASPEVLRIGTVLAAVAAAIGPAILLFGQFALSISSLISVGAQIGALIAPATAVATAVAAIVSPLGLAVAAATALGIAAAATSKRFREFFSSMASGALKDLRDTFAPAVSGIVDLFRGAVIPILGRAASVVGGTLVVAFRVFAKVLRLTVGPILEAIGFILGTAIPAVVGVVTRAFDGFVNFVSKALSKVLGWLKSIAEKLGFLPGPAGDAARAMSESMGAAADQFEQTKVKIEETETATVSFSDAVAKATKEAADATSENLERQQTEFRKTAELLKQIQDEAANPKFDEGKKADEERARRAAESSKALKPDADLVRDPNQDPAAGADKLLNSLRSAGPIIRDVGLALEDSLIGSIDLFNLSAKDAWHSFSESAKRAINSIAQTIVQKLIRGALASALSFIPGVGPVLGAIFSKGPSNQAGLSRAQAIGGPSQTIVLNSFVPASTSDFVRIQVATQESARRDSRFLVGST